MSSKVLKKKKTHPEEACMNRNTVQEYAWEVEQERVVWGQSSFLFCRWQMGKAKHEIGSGRKFPGETR